MRKVEAQSEGKGDHQVMEMHGARTMNASDKGAASAISVGTRVACSRAFLRNTGQYTGWAPFACGVVVEITQEDPVWSKYWSGVGFAVLA
jgi:hypothetical protein